jgi:hypothetical protein
MAQTVECLPSKCNTLKQIHFSLKILKEQEDVTLLPFLSFTICTLMFSVQLKCHSQKPNCVFCLQFRNENNLIGNPWPFTFIF